MQSFAYRLLVAVLLGLASLASAQTLDLADSLSVVSHAKGTPRYRSSKKPRVYVMVSLSLETNPSSVFLTAVKTALSHLDSVLSELEAPDMNAFKFYRMQIERVRDQLRRLPQRHMHHAITESLAEVFLDRGGLAAVRLVGSIEALKTVLEIDNPWYRLQGAEHEKRRRRESLIKVLDALIPKLRAVAEYNGLMIRNTWHADFISGKGTPYPSLAETVQWTLGSYEDIFDFVLIHQAEATDLETALRDPRAYAVVWISHANGGEEGVEGFSNQKIVDWRSNDVSDLFRTIHPNIRFVGLIGCQTKSLVEKFQKEGSYTNNPELWIWSESSKILPQQSTIASLKVIGQLIKKEARLVQTSTRRRPAIDKVPLLPKYQAEYPVYATDLQLMRCSRQPDSRLALKIVRSSTGRRLGRMGLKLYDRLVATLPSAETKQEFTFYLSADDIENALTPHFSVLLFEPVMDGTSIGAVSITAIDDPELTWSLKLNKHGEALGGPLAQVYVTSPTIDMGKYLKPVWPAGCRPR